jgi:hypothetical protein
MAVKKIPLIAIVLCTALLVPGCGSIARAMRAGTVVYDDSLSAEKTTLVVFTEPIHIREYNGTAVEETWYPEDKWRLNRVTLPAGEASILFDLGLLVDHGNYATRVNAKDIELRFNFEAGKEYTVGAYTKTTNWFLGKFEFGIAIYDKAASANGSVGLSVDQAIKTWKLGEAE